MNTRGNDAVAYVRVSTVDQANSPHNLQKQTGECDAVREQIRPRPSAIVKFVDPGESARSMERPQFQNMLEFCRKNKRQFQHFIVQDLSRLARNVADQNEALELFWSLGYTVHS